MCGKNCSEGRQQRMKFPEQDRTSYECGGWITKCGLLAFLFGAAACLAFTNSAVAGTIDITYSELQAQPIMSSDMLTAGTLLLCEQGDKPIKKGAVYVCGISIAPGQNVIHPPSDSITWTAVKGGTQAVFCSDVDPIVDAGDNSPACQKNNGGDGGPLMQGQFAIIEQGIERKGEATPYAPTPGQPGYGKSGSLVVTYTLISDTPEPPMLLLFAGGLALVGFGVLRIQKNRAVRPRMV